MTGTEADVWVQLKMRLVHELQLADERAEAPRIEVPQAPGLPDDFNVEGIHRDKQN